MKGRVCARCVMDDSDRDIQFDGDGVCNHCHYYGQVALRYLRTGDGGRAELDAIAAQMRSGGRGSDYDCVIGVSGGVDSTFVAHYVSRVLHLRPLAVHLDNGWDSELAVHNIEKTLKVLGIDLVTHVLDWEEFRDLQRSFLKASVPDAEIPTDHAIAAVLYSTALERGIPYVISGSNVATEGIMPAGWTYGVWDWRYIHAVHDRFGSVPLRTYPHYSLARILWYGRRGKLRTVRLLDYIPYRKTEALELLQSELGWVYYGGKHYESIYTRFFQGSILPRKFGIDKRRAHLSALICSGQMSRDQALCELQVPPYASSDLEEQDREYAIKKLDLTEEEFEAIMAAPVRTSSDFPTSRRQLALLVRLARIGKRLGLLSGRSDVGL